VTGPVALVGSGEYLPGMLDVERELLAGRPPRFVQLPTAAAPEGEASLAYWAGLGGAQADRLGVEAVPLRVATRDDAEDPELAAQIAGAGLIYLSGGSPPYLAATLRDTMVWKSIVDSWRAGAALAGCSAGAIALTERVPDFRHPLSEPRPGLGVVPRLRVIPHFDRYGAWMSRVPRRLLVGADPTAVIVGIDENTAMISDDLVSWRVRGRQAAWILHADGTRTAYRDGDAFTLD
jgi:cyanophycinase